MNSSPRIYKIQKYSIHDGPGIRTSVFFQGCPLKCAWCHNPESQAFCNDKEEQNLSVTAEQIFTEIKKDMIFYDESGGGVTFSGGEPLSQPDLLELLIDRCRELDIHTCIDTSGFASKESMSRFLRKTDLVLYDIKLINGEDHEKYTGRPVSGILDNLKFLSTLDTQVWLRFPVIPGITNTRENKEAVLSFVEQETRFRKIHLLPFHNTAQGKYDTLNMKNRLTGIKPPGKKDMAYIRDRFAARGFDAVIGG